MALSVEEYEQEMLRQFNEQDTPRAKAQFLTELYLARQAGMMDENQQSALDRFTVTAITPKRTDGTYDFQAAEDLLSCMADIRMDYSIESGASWQAWQNAQNPADRIHAQNCRFMTEVMGSFMLSVGTDVPQEYADRLDQFGTAHEAYSAARLSEHPEETWRADTETHEKYTERIRRLADARTRERVNTMREEDKASFQLADQVQEDPDLSMSSVRERAVFSLSSDATTQYLTATDQSQLVRDLEQIHDIDTLQEYLTAVSEMPFVKDGVTYRDPVKYLLQDCAAVDRQKDRQQFFSAADGYDARNTTRPIPPELREKVENVIRGMSADIAGRSALKQNEILGSYGSARQARGVGERIEAQKATDEMERITSYNAFQRMDRLYYKMATKDKSGPFHRDSEEYQRMFNAVKAIHDMSENGYDDKDPVARAKMMDLMAKANKAANDYAEKEVYEKDGKGRTKHSALGVARKNSALLILDLTTGGAQPNWDRVADRRPRLGRKAETPSSLIGGERANLTEYQGVSDAACQEGARKLAQKKAQRERALSDIRTAKLREGRMRQEHPQSAEHMKEMKSRATALSANLVGVAVDTRMPADQMDMVVAKQASVNMPFQKIREQADAYKKGVEERFEKNVTANYEKNYLLAQQRSAQVVAGRTGDLMGDMEHRLDEMRKERESSKKPKEKSPQEKSLEELHRATKGFTDLAGVDTSRMSKEELVKYDFALSQAAKSMEQAAKDYSQIAAGGRFRRKQDPMAQVADQIEAAAGYTSKMTREERARLRSGYASDRRRMEQAVAQRTQDMRMNYMRQAGMLPAAPAQQMRQAPQQMQAQYMQAQTAYRQTTMQYQGAQATVQSLQMQMLQAQRNLMAAEMARYQARMAYLDVQIQMAQMGMAPHQMGMAPQQMGMGPQPMGMGPQPMGMMPQQFGGSPYVQQAQAIRPTFGPQGMTMGPGWLPYGVQLQPATPTATPKAAPTSSQPTEPDLPMQEEVEAASKKAVESEKPSPPSKESVEHTIDKSLLTPEDQKGLFTDLELKGGLPAEKMAEIGKIRRQARKEGIDLNAPVDESLIPDWAKKEGATAAEAEMGKLAAHREANRLAKQKAAAAEAKPQTRERSTVNTAHPPKPTGLETAKPQTPQTRERSTVNTAHPPKPTGLEAAKSQAKQKKTPEKKKEEGQKKWREARKASQQERKADGPKIGVHK